MWDRHFFGSVGTPIVTYDDFPDHIPRNLPDHIPYGILLIEGWNYYIDQPII